MQTGKQRILAFYALLAALGTFFALGSAELMGRLLLERRAGGSPYSLFFQASESSSLKRFFMFPLIDPLLGWGRNPPFRAYYSEAVPEEQRGRELVAGQRLAGTKRIVGLGGSTTDPEIERQNWVYQLSLLCGGRTRCQTLNGGIGGYSSGQELLKLARDTLPLEPDLVISLNGINDESLPVFDGRTFVNNHQQAINKALRVSEWDSDSPLASPPALRGLFPHARFLLRVIGFALTPRVEKEEPIGIADGYSPSRRWETNVRMMHALAQEFGVRYFVFLQPHLGLDPEKAQEKIRELGAPYIYDVEHLRRFYSEAGAACRKLSYCSDISGEFRGKSALFKDIMHLNAEGHALEARLMYETLRKKGLL